MPIAEGVVFDLTFVWGFLIALAVLIYVVLDGFDLGLGMLFAVEPERRHRDVMMNSVAPVWDGNETWLVLGGGGLFAAFPLAYALILPALYAPIIAMLLALIFRGVAFEFRWRTERWRGVWDVAFIGGSAVAALSQCLVAHLDELDDAGTPAPRPRDWILRENKWRAGRHGLDAELIVDDAGTVRPARDELRRLVQELAPTAERLGCTAELADVVRVLDAGASYERQRRVADGGRNLWAVVDQLARELSSGEPDAPEPAR